MALRLAGVRSTDQSTWWLRMSPLAVYLVPCVLAVLCYVNGLTGEFLHDDVYAIENNPDVTGKSPLWQLFRNDFWGRTMSDWRSHKSYRPFTVLTFRLDYLLSEGNSGWFHAVNIVLHACVTALVVLVSMRVLRATPTVSGLAAAHFAVHPIHTEAVTGIVGRADVLSALLFLTSFYCYSRCIHDVSKSATSAPTTPSIPSTPSTPSTPTTPSSTSSRSSPVRDVNFNHLTNLSPASPTPPAQTQTLQPNSGTNPVATGAHSAMSPMTSHGDFLYLLTSLALAGAAVLCKETGITVLGVAFLYDVILNRAHFQRFFKLREFTAQLKACMVRLCCLCVWGALVMTLRGWVMEFQQPTFKAEDNPAAEATSRLTRTLTFLYLPAMNLWLLLCPLTLSYDWAVGSIPLVTHIGDPRNAWTVLAYFILLMLSWRSLRHMISQSSTGSSDDAKIREKQEKTTCQSNPGFVVMMGLVFLCVPFIPASNLFFKVGFVIAERVLYIPSIGFSLLVVQGLSCLCSRVLCRKLLFLIFGGLLLVLGCRTVQRNQDWTSRRSLFISGVKSLPHNAKMHYNVANLLRDEGDTDAAEAHYREAIRLNPDHPSYHLNLGAILTNRSEAESCYTEALRIHPTHVGSLVNLGTLWMQDGKTESGVSLLQRAVDLDPNHAEGLLAYGQALLKLGDTWRAGRHIQRAMESRPNWASAQFYYATFLQHTDDLEGALREYLRVLDLDEEKSLAMNNAARILISFERYSEAEPLLKRALAVDPSCWDCLSVLATSYSKRGQYREAVVTLGQASTLAPNDTKISLKYVEALKQSKQTEKAQMFLQNLLAKVPEDLTVLTFAYNYAMEEDRLSDASHYIREAVSVAEQTGHASLSKLYFEQGEIHRFKQHYDKALQFYKKSMRKDHHHIDPIVSAGSILYLQGIYREAEVFYLKALSINPNHYLAKHNLAKLRNYLENNGQNT